MRAVLRATGDGPIRPLQEAVAEQIEFIEDLANATRPWGDAEFTLHLTALAESGVAGGPLDLIAEEISRNAWDTGPGDIEALALHLSAMPDGPFSDAEPYPDVKAVVMVTEGEIVPTDALLPGGRSVLLPAERTPLRARFVFAVDVLGTTYHAVRRRDADREPVTVYPALPPPGRIPQMLGRALEAVRGGYLGDL
jgi:hypothetical protein